MRENQKHYNEHVDCVICGPLTTAEIAALISKGLRFSSRSLDTEYSLAALAALARAPRDHVGEQTMALGRLEALQVLASRTNEGLEWFEGFEEGAALVTDAARASGHWR